MSHSDNLEKALRQKLRFTTTRGDLTPEDLYFLNLTSKVGHVSLDGIVVDLYNKLQNTAKTSFVTKASVVDETLQLQFDIAKHILDLRVAEAEAKSTAQEKALKAASLRNLIAEKKGEALAAMPLADLEAELARVEAQ